MLDWTRLQTCLRGLDSNGRVQAASYQVMEGDDTSSRLGDGTVVVRGQAGGAGGGRELRI
jgi:hypothetical protein